MHTSLEGRRFQRNSRHSGRSAAEGRNPGFPRKYWIPAFAGMTRGRVQTEMCACRSAKAGTQSFHDSWFPALRGACPRAGLLPDPWASAGMTNLRSGAGAKAERRLSRPRPRRRRRLELAEEGGELAIEPGDLEAALPDRLVRGGGGEMAILGRPHLTSLGVEHAWPPHHRHAAPLRPVATPENA